MGTRAVRVVVALVAGALALVLIAHLPMVRARVLRYALAEVQRRYAIRLEASRLDYNLAALRVGLADVRLSTATASDIPFFEAEYLATTFPGRALTGALAFDDISVTGGRVRVVRRPDGTTNLPESSDTPTGDPPALSIARLNIPKLAIEIRDEQGDLGLVVPQLELELTASRGRVALGAPAEVRRGPRTTQITRLEGGATFDGRALHLDGVQVDAVEATLRADGSLTLIARESAMNLRVSGTANAERLARWAVTDGDLPQGVIAFDALLTGPFGNPAAALELSADTISWQRLSFATVVAQATVTTTAADVPRLEFDLEGGRVFASGMAPFEEGSEGRLSATWDGVRAAGLTRAIAPESVVVPSAVLSGQLEGRGPLSDASQWAAEATVRMAPGGNARGLISTGGNARIELRDGSWRLDAQQQIGGAAPVQIALRGPIREMGAPRNLGGIRVGRTDIPKLLRVLAVTSVADVPDTLVRNGSLTADIQLAGSIADPDMRARVDVQELSATQIDAEAVRLELSGRPLSRQVNYTLGSERAVVAGEAVTDIRARGRLAGTVLVVEELFASQPASSGLLTGSVLYAIPSGGYQGSIEVTEWQVNAAAEQPFSGRINVRFSGEGTTAEPRGRGQVALRGAAWQQIELGDVDAGVELDGQSATIQARAPDFQTQVAARVQLAAPYAAVVAVRGDEVDLARVLRGVETPAPVSGTVTMTARGEGPLDAWRTGSATLDVVTLNATAGELPLRLSRPARLRYEKERVIVDTLEATAGETALSLSGELPVTGAAPDAALIVEVTGDVEEVARGVAATGLARVPVTNGDGPVVLRARVTGSLETPVIAADLEVGPGSVAVEGFPAVTGLRVRAHAEQGWVELREGAASYQGAALTATGRAPVSLLLPRAGGASGNLELSARATGLTPAVMEPFLDPATLDQLSGSVDAALDLTSPTLEIADLTGELRLDRLEIRLADLPVTQRAPTRIVARDGLARIEAWDWTGQGATLTVRGQVRLSDRQAAILANGDLDVRMLTPFVRAAGITTAGRLEPRLSITGPIDNPRIDGDALLSAGEVRLNDPRMLISDLAARAVLTGNSLRLTSLTGQVNGGPLTGEGEVSWTRDNGLAARLTADARGMALEFPQGLRSEANAALELVMADPPGDGAAAGPAGRVSGTVTVVRGAYREPMAVVTGLLTTLRARRLATGATGPSPLLESLALDVRLVTDEDLIVDNNYGRFQLGADLRVIGTAAAPALSGRAELREGGQLFVGRNVYTISTGTIDFTNPVTIEPELNLVATTRAGGEDIELQIAGTPDDPDISPRSTSDPSLGEAEVVSLLLTGRRLEDLAPGDAAFVGTQVLGNFSAEVLGFASRAVGLDTVRLGGVETARRDPTAIATEADPTTRLTFGKSFGTNIDVTFSQSLRDNDAQTWIVDYLPSRRLVLRLVSDDDNLRSYGFRHDVSFGGSAPGPVASQGVSRPQAARVAAVSVTGMLVLPEERVRDVLRLQVGDRFDFADWQEDRDRLEAFYHEQGYLTARVTPARSDGNEGVSLVYTITPGPETRIQASGIDLDGTLRSRLETAWSQSVFDDFLVEEATTIVRERLAQEGYLQPTLDLRVVTDARTKTLAVNVDRGNRTTDISVRVEGADEPLSEEIEDWLEMRNVGIALLPTQAGAVERDLAAYLRSRGYLRAQVTVGAPAFEAASATVPVTVVPGPIFTVVGVSFVGAGPLTEDLLRETADIESGTPYDPTTADAARDRLVAVYRREGFPAPSVTVQQMVNPETPVVGLTFAIEPGTRQVIGEVVVTGNRAIDTDVIVRALELSPDRPLRTEESLQARRRVFDTGLFRRVDVSTEPMEPGSGIRDPGSETPMRVTVTVEEWPAVRLRYGFQVAEERPETEIDGRTLVPGLSADLTRRTLFGRAIATGGAFELQRRERLGRAFINTPTFFGWPVESSLTVDRTRRTIAGTDRIDDRSGISAEQRIRLLTDQLQLSYGYRRDRSRTEIPPDPILGSFPPIVVDMGRLVGAASFDRRDDPYDARSGFLASSSLEYAPRGLGSDIRFVRFLAQGYSFSSWRSVVLASAARVGAAKALDGQELLGSERFFAGGATTVRGVAEGTLGGLDFFGSPIGGEAFIVLNQEVRVPLFGWVRGVGFIDVGNVFPRMSDFQLSSLIGSAGLGVRVATPFALFRIDYARPVWGGPVAQAHRWTFGIGNTF